MIRILFIQQLAEHLKSLRLQISLVVIAGLFGASGVVYVYKYLRLTDLAPIVQRDVDRRYDVETANELIDSRLRLLNERLPTEFMTEGGANWFGDSFQIEARTGGTFDYRSASRSSNHWVRRYEFVDWTFIVRLVISFLCIVLAYDTLSAGRESGTLRLVLANPVSRLHLLGASVGAHLVVVVSVVAVGCLLGILVLSLTQTIALSWSILVDTLLFLAGTTLYAALFLLLATGVSAVARSSATSLVFLVLVWAILIVVVPQTSYLIATKGVDVDHRWKMGLVDAVDDLNQELEQQGLLPRRPAEAATDGHQHEQRYLRLLEQAEREGFARLQSQYGTSLAQYRLARAVNMVSPGMAFQYTAEALLRTGLGKYMHLEDQARRYRDDLRDFVRARDAQDPDSPHLLFLSGFVSKAPLDAQHIPRFQEQRLPLARSLTLVWLPLALLVAEACAAAIFAMWAVARMQISGD